MDNWEYIQFTLVYSRAELHSLEAIIINDQQPPLPQNVQTRTQILDYYDKLGWIVVKSYSDVNSFKRALAA